MSTPPPEADTSLADDTGSVTTPESDPDDLAALGSAILLSSSGLPLRNSTNSAGADGSSLLDAGIAAPQAAATASAATLGATGAAIPVENAPDADGWITAGGFLVKGGVPGEAGSGDFYLTYFEGSAGARVLHVRTSTPLTVRTPAQTSDTIQIDPGVKADVTLAGIDIKNTASKWAPPINLVNNLYDTESGKAATCDGEIRSKTSLYLTLADGSINKLTPGNTGSLHTPGIRCSWGSILVIDDSIRNLDENNQIVVPNDGIIDRDVRLSNGTVLPAGSFATTLDSPNPGSLSVPLSDLSAGIGGGMYENAGKLIFNGGNVEVKETQGNLRSTGIGSGFCGSSTSITFNGGDVYASCGMCGTAIGTNLGWAINGFGPSHASIFPDDAIDIAKSEEDAHDFGWYGAWGQDDYIAPMQCGSPAYHTIAGDITINGGRVEAVGAGHGNAIGRACPHSWTSNKHHIIRITGGTVIADGKAAWEYSKDIGAVGGYTIVSGGSVHITKDSAGNPSFMGLGDTAYNTAGVSSWDDVEALGGALPDDDKVFMVEIDLTSELRANGTTDLNRPITSWSLSVGSMPVSYGAPSYFDEGKLYLWLPKTAETQQVSVTLSYRGEDGEIKELSPLFRNPGQADLLKRYVTFNLPDTYTGNGNLRKYYDGLRLPTFDLAANPLPSNEATPKMLDDPSKAIVRQQRYTAVDGTPVSEERIIDSAGVVAGEAMPADAGIFKCTIESTQYANETTDGFNRNYWGHQAIAWAEILPIPSVAENLSVTWADEPEDDRRPGEVEHPATEALTFSADIKRGATVDGTPDGAATAGTCKAPEGRVQLYVDGDPVGTPIDIRFEDETDDNTRAVTAKKNAERVDNGEGGSYTHFTYTASPTDGDWILPASTETNRHKVSLRFLPPTDAQIADGAPANYLASEEPRREAMDDPDSPWADVTVEPVDPKTEVERRPDPDKADERFPDPDVQTDEGAPGGPDGNGHPVTVHNGTIRTTYGEPTEANPHPGRVILAIDTPSSAPVKVTDNTGNVVTAEFATDGDGNPVRDEGGAFVLVIDPVAVGGGALKIVQEANGAYNGTEWNYAVKVNPDASIPPEPRLAKRAENLTHPDGPTQPGDRIRYTIEASNAAAGSLWTDVVASDALPACLELDEGSVRLSSPASGFEGALRKAAGAPSLGEFSLSAPGAGGRPVLAVAMGSASSASPAVVTFECAVARDIDFSDPAAATDLANVAEATGTRPDPDDPDRPLEDPDRPGEPVPVVPGPTDPVTPPGPGTVVPADPGAGDVRVTKAAENLTRPREDVTHVGDRVRYTITLENAGAADSVLYDALISDPLPVGLEPVAGTLRLAGPGGSSVPVADGAYRQASRTLAVSVGDLWGGQAWTLAFECEVTADAVGADVTNIALAFGTTPSDDPGRDPADPGWEPGEAVDPPAPGTEPVAESDPALPPEVRPDDPEGGDVAIVKTAENATRSDGTVHVGDTVRYEIRLWNSAPGTGWIDAVVRDDVPAGVEPVSGTISLALPDGSSVAVPDAAYDPASRILAVAVGRLYGGQEARLTFDALVTEDAVGADIGNVAAGYGTLPSQRGPGDPELVPGEPFTPAEGWDAYGARRDVQTIRTDPVYPEGADKNGGVIDDGEPADDSTTIARKLAQTGDRAMAAALGIAAAAALAACALCLASRRRDRRAR